MKKTVGCLVGLSAIPIVLGPIMFGLGGLTGLVLFTILPLLAIVAIVAGTVGSRARGPATDRA